MPKLDADGNQMFDDAGNVIFEVDDARGLNGAIGVAKSKHSNDKGSVVYKNQMRIEEERKNKNG